MQPCGPGRSRLAALQRSCPAPIPVPGTTTQWWCFASAKQMTGCVVSSGVAVQ
jgi:hypothetical protein